MDDRIRQELTAWLEFYGELGIEDLYRRTPSPEMLSDRVDRAASVGAFTGERIDAAPDVGAAHPRATQADPSTLQKAPLTGLTQPVASMPPGDTAHPLSASGPPPQSLSLFEPSPPPRRERETLEQVREDLGDCQRCRLSAGRKTIVFGQGNSRAAVVFVGEGPGADEDEQGLPFVGRAGQLLNRMLQLIGIKREDVYICNVVKCRPPGNRTPERDEIDTCSPFLFRQIAAIQPRLVCCLGAPAVRTLLGLKEGITKIRGQFFNYGGAKALATVHPAYVLRNPREEKILREDFEKIREFLKKPS